ncbi:Hypothetical predicted protein [Paramuricea clavata]|nr:Hypothetical predicted protein [Paramuricea clavata]
MHQNRTSDSFNTQLVASTSNKSAKEAAVKEGDIFRVKDDKHQRNTWKLGRIKEMIRSSGRIPEQFSEIKRSIEYLVPVECNQEPAPCSFWSSIVNDMSVADSNVSCVVMNAEGTTPTFMNSRGKPGRPAAITSNFK